MQLVLKPLVFGIIVMSAAPAHSQEYPVKPIRIFTGSAGGSTDFLTRQIAQALSISLGQQMVVDNRAALLSAETVAKAAPDGYTLVVGGGSLWIFPLLGPTSYDPIRDFSPITQIESSPNVVVAHPSLRVKSIRELIDLARARPGELNYASSGVGTTPHLATELFRSMAGINIVHVPYKGNGPALIDLIGGQVQLSFVSAPAAITHVKAGRLRALAVTSLQPSALTPGMPTVASTVPGYESVGISAMFAPAKTPAAIIKRLNEETVRFLRTAEARQLLLANGAEVVAGSPEQLAGAVKAEMERLGKVVKEAGIR